MPDDLRSKRCVFIARASTSCQAENDINHQLVQMRRFAADHQMVCVDEICLRDVEGGVTSAIVNHLIGRKLKHDDFDSVLVCDYSRLGRRVACEGMPVLKRLRLAGIEVLSATDDPATIMMAHVMAGVGRLVARSEQEVRSARAKAAWARRKQGKNGGGK